MTDLHPVEHDLAARLVPGCCCTGSYAPPDRGGRRGVVIGSSNVDTSDVGNQITVGLGPVPTACVNNAPFINSNVIDLSLTFRVPEFAVSLFIKSVSSFAGFCREFVLFLQSTTLVTGQSHKHKWVHVVALLGQARHT